MPPPTEHLLLAQFIRDAGLSRVEAAVRLGMPLHVLNDYLDQRRAIPGRLLRRAERLKDAGP